MSYNVDTIEYIGDGRLSIRRGIAVGLQVTLEEERLLPDCSLFEDLDLEGDPDEMLVLERLNWYGEGSGHCFDEGLVDCVLPATRGHAQFGVIWEGGDSITGLEVRDGVVVTRKAGLALL
jgi:hypothetical protein